MTLFAVTAGAVEVEASEDPFMMMPEDDDDDDSEEELKRI